jgi:hypothetical protein
MKRVRQLCFYIGAGLVLMAALAALGIHVENIRTRRKAESLLSAVRQLRAGESTFSSTQSILTEFGAERLAVSPVSGGLPPESRYAIFIANSLLCKLELRFPSLWRFGFRPAWIEAEFNYKEELLTSVTYTLNTPAFTSSSGPVELAAVAFLGEDSNLEPHRSFNVFYRIWPSFMVPRAFRITFGVGLTPSATESERDAGFDFDLSCVSSFRGCSAFCQLMPSVWREGWRRYESKEMSLPKELLEDPNCYSAKNHLATSFWRSKQ